MIWRNCLCRSFWRKVKVDIETQMEKFELYIIIMMKPGQRCSGFLYAKKINAPYIGAESEEEDESYQFT